MTDGIVIDTHTPFADDGNLKKGQKYVKLGLTHQEAFATPEEAVNFANELVKASGLPYAIIHLGAKRDDALIRTPVENTAKLVGKESHDTNASTPDSSGHGVDGSDGGVLPA